MQIGPYPANSVADHSPSDLTEPRTIEIPQIDDVGGHRDILAPVARSARCANPPAFFYLIASVCFILTFRGSSSPLTAPVGNICGVAAIVSAVVRLRRLVTGRSFMMLFGAPSTASPITDVLESRRARLLDESGEGRPFAGA